MSYSIFRSVSLTVALAFAGVLVTGAASAAPHSGAAWLPKTAYESVRGGLATNNLAAVKAAAKKGAAEGRAKARGSVEAKAFIALAAAKDLSAARVAFASLSRAFITELAAHPAAAKGLVCYRCPMAKVYKKWVQRAGTKTGNPYLGTKSPHCGAKVPMAP